MKKCSTKETTKRNNTRQIVKDKNNIKTTMCGEDTTTYGQEYPVGTFKNSNSNNQIRG